MARHRPQSGASLVALCDPIRPSWGSTELGRIVVAHAGMERMEFRVTASIRARTLFSLAEADGITPRGRQREVHELACNPLVLCARESLVVSCVLSKLAVATWQTYTLPQLPGRQA